MATSTDQYARKYASAFLQALDPSADVLKKAEQELLTLSFFSHEPALSFFINPVFHTDEKTAVMTEIFSKHAFSEETKQFVLTLMSLNQIHLMEEIAKYFSEALNVKNQETRIQVETAYALSTSEQEKIRETFEKTVGKKVILDITVDRELIGGIRAQVGGVVYDSSIQGHLLRLQKEFTV